MVYNLPYTDKKACDREMMFLNKNTKLPGYLPYPRFLLKIPASDTAKLVYILLLDRAQLSQANGWEDEQGRVYVIYTVDALAKDTGKSDRTVTAALGELEKAGLLLRLRTAPCGANKLYPKLPPAESCLSHMKKSSGGSGRKLQVSNNNKNQTNKRDYNFFSKGELP